MPLSAKIPATPIPGTKFYNYLKEKDLFISGEVYYEFQDKGVGVCFDIKNIWDEKIFPVYFKHYLITKAADNGEAEIAQSLRKEKSRLIKLDLDFIEELALEVKNNNLTIDNCGDFIARYDGTLQEIYTKFMDAKKVLDKYEG